jgi:hypothetical protein
MNMKRTFCFCIILILSMAAITPIEVYGQNAVTVFRENFESGQGSWFADNGVWEVGKPVAGPNNAHSAQNCAATILGGNYPPYANTRLVSPIITLPNVTAGEQLRLVFWHWFVMNEDDFYGPDEGRVQISVNGGNWQPLAGPFSGISTVWTQTCLDLSAHAGANIRLAFYFISTQRAEASGWYIDDIEIKKGVFPFNNPENFELGIGDWCVDNGVWEVGKPTGGPANMHSGQNCAATILSGNYPQYANTRLISPEIILPSLTAGEQLRLFFWHWFVMNEDDFYGPDEGRVQVSVNGGNWQTLAGPFSGISSVWTRVCVNLSAFAGSKVRLAFYFTSTQRAEANGWYVDDIEIKKGAFAFVNPDSFKLGIGDWYVDNGVWEVGKPSVGPANAHSVPNCAATVLGGNYPPYANTRLVSPEIILKRISGQGIALFFWQWFRMNEDDFYGPDQGYVQISVKGGPWKNIAGPYTGISTVWSQAFADISAYADSTVRIAFYFTSTQRAEDNGWYIDDIRIEGVTSVKEIASETPSVFTLEQNYPNPFNPSTTISFSLPRSGRVTLKVFDLLGKQIATLVDHDLPPGRHEAHWDASGIESGLYFYQLRSGEFVETKRLVLLK